MSLLTAVGVSVRLVRADVEPMFSKVIVEYFVDEFPLISFWPNVRPKLINRRTNLRLFLAQLA